MSWDDLKVTDLRRRRGEKWQDYPEDVLAAWVADMDFDPPEVVTVALQEILDAGDLGYRFVARPDEVFSDWQMSRHGWCPDPARTTVFTTAPR